MFVNATWYSDTVTPAGYYVEQLQNNTLMTNAEIQTLYNTAIPTSFGAFYVQVCSQIAIKYTCKST
jgi:hypothetical protein